MHFEQTKPKQYKKVNHIKVMDGQEYQKQMSNDTFKATKALHKEHIKQARADIYKHKLLIKQAKIAYKLSK